MVRRRGGRRRPGFRSSGSFKFSTAKEKSEVTVKDLIIKLLECDMNDLIVIRDKYGKQLHGVSINTIKGDGLWALFG